MKKTLAVLFALLFASTSFAVSPFFFKGYVHVNGTLAPNGTVITVYVNNDPTPKNSVVIGQGVLHGVVPTGFYTIAVEANTGDNVTFRVNNISLISSNGTNTSPQRLGSVVVESFNISVNKSADGGACAYDIGCTGNFCVHSICRSASTHCGDGFCDSGESCSSDDSACSSGYACTNGCVATVTAATPVPGGGGAVVTPAPVVEEKVTVDIISANVPKTIDITKTKEVAVDEIVITTNTVATNVVVTVKESSKPAEAPAPVAATTGSVYKYVDITVTNVPTGAISAAKVKFKVTKLWITDNSIDANTVKLNRLVGTSWTALKTTKVSEDPAEITYEADTLGFSTFAISGEKKPAPTPTPSACGNRYCDIGHLNICESPSSCSADCSSAAYESCRSECSSSDQYPLYIADTGRCICTSLNPCALQQIAATPTASPVVTPTPFIVPPEKKPKDYTLLYITAVIVLIVALYLFIRRRQQRFRLFRGRHKQRYVFRPPKHHEHHEKRHGTESKS